MDVLTHCIEAYLGTAFNPPADGIALEGLRLAGASLPRAIADASDHEARREMMAAAICAGLAAQKGLGGVHALAHALEEVSDDATAARSDACGAAAADPCVQRAGRGQPLWRDPRLPATRRRRRTLPGWFAALGERLAPADGAGRSGAGRCGAHGGSPDGPKPNRPTAPTRGWPRRGDYRRLIDAAVDRGRG